MPRADCIPHDMRMTVDTLEPCHHTTPMCCHGREPRGKVLNRESLSPLSDRDDDRAVVTTAAYLIVDRGYVAAGTKVAVRLAVRVRVAAGRTVVDPFAVRVRVAAVRAVVVLPGGWDHAAGRTVAVRLVDRVRVAAVRKVVVLPGDWDHAAGTKVADPSGSPDSAPTTLYSDARTAATDPTGSRNLVGVTAPDAAGSCGAEVHFEARPD